MAEFNTKAIRNICLLGHGGSGKTTLAEAMLFCAGATDRMGKIADRNTVCDFDPEEARRGFSLNLSVASFTWKSVKINVIDTPGFLDFEGDVCSGLRAADAAVITVDGKAGLEVGTELAWNNAVEAGIPRAFFITNYEDPEAGFGRVFGQLKDKFGAAVCPVCVPVKRDGAFRLINLVEMKAYSFIEGGRREEVEMDDELLGIAAKYKDALNEAVAETSEEMLDKYFAGEEITIEETVLAIHEGIISGTIVPVYCGSAEKLWGVRAFLNSIEESFPRFTARGHEISESGDEIAIDPAGDCALYVFKTVSDQFGRQSYYKVMSGELHADTMLKNSRGGAVEKIAKLSCPFGKKQIEASVLHTGDIGVISKLSSAATGDTLSVSGDVEYSRVKFRESYMCRAIEVDGKGDEDKVTSGIFKLIEEDPTYRYENDSETKQMLIYGAGDMHLDVLVARLKARYGVSINLREPRLAYRETIKKSVQVEGKHKKQSGGSGQYGHVKITFSPGEAEGLTFTQSVVGGNVPKGYYPAVEKGLLEAMQKGVLAGYPVVNLAADLFDGSYHPVDSNEISFKLAAKLAYKEGLPKANPVLLEPVGSLLVSVPNNLVGDVIGDLNKRRGQVLGMNPDEKKPEYTVVEAEAPKAEMSDYVIALRAMSQGRGSFTFKVTRYDEVPGAIAQKIIAAAAKEE